MAYSKIKAATEEETFLAGFELAKTLKPGDIVTLDGDLGAGKTVFTKGICKYFNVTDYVVSPTYTIVNEYNGDVPVYHFDIYRIEEEEELFNIGFYEYLDNDGIKIIEWASKIPEAFEGYPLIKITIEKNGGFESDERVIITEVE